MKEINTRFKLLRESCKKTQAEFGKILGLSVSGVSDIERGKRNVTDQHIIMLSNWHEKKININWLRTGEGGAENMFLHPEQNDLTARAAALLEEKDPLFETLVITYSKLTSESKKMLLDFFKELSNNYSIS